MESQNEAVILVFGTICLDRVRRIPHFPKPGGYVEITDEQALLGGEAVNTALALHEWGADVVLAGNPLGNDKEADDLRTAIKSKSVRYIESPSEQNRAPVCDVLITPDGERTMIGRGFSALDGTVDLAHLPFPSGGWFTAEPNMAQTSREAARLAHKAGMRLYLMDFFHEDEFIPPGSFCQFSTDWVGERGNDAANLDWVHAWTERHKCTTILTDGPNGFAISSPQGAEGGGLTRWYPATDPKKPAADSTGAGDIFRAGMLFGLSQDWPLERCLSFAAAAGALATTTFGASAIIPNLQATEALTG